MNPRCRRLVPVWLAVAAACTHPARSDGDRSPNSMPASAPNPFFAPSPLPLQAPPFDRIRDGDYAPALAAGMAQQLAEIAQITALPAPATFADTIEALERTGALLTRAAKAFFAMAQANTNPALQQVETDMAPKLAAHRDAIYLDSRLFARVHDLFERRKELGLDAEQLMVLERWHRDFVRAGALLPPAQQARLKELNQELSSLSTEFRKLLLAANKDGAVVVDDAGSLAGLDEAEVAAAAAAAKERQLDGKWVLALQNTTQQPALGSLQDRGLRQRLLEASMARGDRAGAADTRPAILKMAALRAEKARMFGFPDYAGYVLDDQMAKTSAAATKLLTDMVPAAVAKAGGEVKKMQALVDAGGQHFTVAACDYALVQERVRKADFELDEAAIKPYFELESVLQRGVFFAAHELYGLSFAERKDLPVYHPDVRVFEVVDGERTIALWYCDYFRRDNKNGGAWEDSFVDQSTLLGTQAVVFNVCNFQKPAAGQPALLSFDDVTTMFHEFGHALHGMLSAVRYPLLSGTNVPRDYVEFPSQFNEHWATEPRVLANYARHWQSGAPMPQALADKLRLTKTFNQGYATTEYLAAALLDLAWHSLPGEPPADVDAFERAALRRFGIEVPEVPPRYRTTYFAHIWGGEYAAGYYAYLWSEVLDDDAFAWFTEHGGMTRENGQRFRDLVLSRGYTIECGAMYRAFSGRDPSVEPLLRERGLK
jgi:peptidyl-dipeptidase Dcp